MRNLINITFPNLKTKILLAALLVTASLHWWACSKKDHPLVNTPINVSYPLDSTYAFFSRMHDGVKQELAITYNIPGKVIADFYFDGVPVAALRGDLTPGRKIVNLTFTQIGETVEGTLVQGTSGYFLEKLSVNDKSTSFTEKGWLRIAKGAITQDDTELAPYFKGIESLKYKNDQAVHDLYTRVSDFAQAASKDIELLDGAMPCWWDCISCVAGLLLFGLELATLPSCAAPPWAHCAIAIAALIATPTFVGIDCAECIACLAEE